MERGTKALPFDVCCIPMHRKQFHFGGAELVGAELVGAAPLGGSGGMPPRKILNFTHSQSEIVSRAILQVLDDML